MVQRIEHQGGFTGPRNTRYHGQPVTDMRTDIFQVVLGCPFDKNIHFSNRRVISNILHYVFLYCHYTSKSVSES